MGPSSVLANILDSDHLESLKPREKKMKARKIFTFPLLFTELISVTFCIFIAYVI
jgi:hypothetical protein